MPLARKSKLKRKGPPTEAALLRGMFEYRDFAGELPEFNVVAVNKLFRSFYRRIIVGAFKLY
jgi:hypothetical protein